MAHVVNYWPKPFLYAFGNTPPVCLTDSIPPEVAADVLLLGCGDVRNILHTLREASTKDGKLLHPHLDFTCCDIEPAIIARNILLLTLLADDTANSKLESIWDVFYHIYLTPDAHTLLCDQTSVLLQHSESLSIWHSSKYGRWLRIMTEETLSTVRELWKQYVSTKNMSTGQKDGYEGRYRKGVKETAEFRKSKGTGLMAYSAISPVLPTGEISTVFEGIITSYWEKGRTGTGTATVPNPTLAFSGRGEEFILHYASCPPLSFHLPAVGVAMADNPRLKADFVIGECKKQFNDWAASLRQVLTKQPAKPKLTIRFSIADLFSLCGTLACGQLACGRYTNPWNSTELVLSEEDYGKNAKLPAPRDFNIIDTSNLADHVAFLNLLTATAPLLRTTPDSVLLTETLGHVDTPATNFLKEILCGDQYVMGVLLDLLPASLFTGYTSRSNPGATLSKVFNTSGISENPVFDRTHWKRLSVNDGATGQIKFTPNAIAAFLFKVYTKMFEEENLTAMYQQKLSLGTKKPKMIGLTHYTRESFARLLAYIKPKFTASDWDAVMNEFGFLLVNDSQLFCGKNHFQELRAFLGITGAFDINDVEVVSLTLRVPRSKLAPLLEGKLSEMGTPALQLVIESPGSAGHSVFHAVQPVFGRIETIEKDGSSLRIVPDKAGVFGSEDLIVTVKVTSEMVNVMVGQTTVSLQIHPSMASIQYFKGKLAPDLALYRTALGDKKSVFITKTPPNITSAELKAGEGKVKEEVSPTHFVVLNSGNDAVERIGVKFFGFRSPHNQELRDGAAVECVVEEGVSYLKFGSFKEVVPFPLPVVEGSIKTRIARKSQFIEILAPLDYANPIRNRFQLMILPTSPPSFIPPVHRVNLSTLPTIAPSSSLPGHLQPHLTTAFSARELTLQKASSTGNPTTDLMTNLKDTLSHLFFSFTKDSPNRPFVLVGTDTPPGAPKAGVDTLIILTSLHLDPPSHTFLLSAFILPLTTSLISDPTSPVRQLIQNPAHPIRTVKTAPGEQQALKSIWVNAAERCRTWSHRKNCTYLKTRGPVSTEIGTNPFCLCARGTGNAEFEKLGLDPRLGGLVTRVAIGTLFAVPYTERSAVDDIAAGMKSSAPLSPQGQLGATKVEGKEEDWEGRCRACGIRREGLKTCTGCRRVGYCDAGCQKMDWKRHKGECRK